MTKLLGLLLILASCHRREEKKESCFASHIGEAISVNFKRTIPYKKISDGKSLRFSLKMMATESLLWPVMKTLEIFAQKYWEKGIPILCYDVVSMDGIKPLSLYTPFSVQEKNFKIIPIDEIKIELQKQIEQGAYAQASAMAKKWVENLSDQPHSHCMTRHTLESLSRVLYLTPVYVNGSLKAGLPSSEWISKAVIKVHLMGLIEAYRSDEEAYPLQKSGVAIICQDIPAIEMRPSLKGIGDN